LEPGAAAQNPRLKAESTKLIAHSEEQRAGGMEEKAKGVRHEAKGIGRRKCSKLKAERGEGITLARRWRLEEHCALGWRQHLTIHCLH